MARARWLVVCVGVVGLAGCGQTIGYPGALPPAHTAAYRSEPASALAAGADPMSALLQRPIRPPAPQSDGSCVPSSDGDLGSVAPNYGAGVGPAYLSGQDAWYAGGQVAVLMVKPGYSGPLLVRPFVMGGAGNGVLTLTDFSGLNPETDLKEKEHGVLVAPVVAAPGGGMFLPAVPVTSYWRAAFSRLSSNVAGCYGLQVDGDSFTEFIVVQVNPGNPPPG